MRGDGESSSLWLHVVYFRVRFFALSDINRSAMDVWVYFSMFIMLRVKSRRHLRRVFWLVFRAALQVDQLLNILCSTGNYANAARSLIEVFATSYKITQHLATHNRLPVTRYLVLLAELTCTKTDLLNGYKTCIWSTDSWSIWESLRIVFRQIWIYCLTMDNLRTSTKYRFHAQQKFILAKYY